MVFKLKRKRSAQALPAAAAAEAPPRSSSILHCLPSIKQCMFFLLCCAGCVVVGTILNRGSIGLNGVTTATDCTKDISSISTKTSSENENSPHKSYTLLTEAKHLLNDPTMRLSPHVDRPWLDPTRKDKPKVKLVLPDFGWNNGDQATGLRMFRSIAGREQLQAFIDHPYFDPTFVWADARQNPDQIDTSLTYIVMLDLETLFENNYPVYAAREHDSNTDRQHGRPWMNHEQCACGRYETCAAYVKHVLESPLFQKVKASSLLFSAYGPLNDPEQGRNVPEWNNQITQMAISARTTQLFTETDMGFPPPNLNPLTLTPEERTQIHHCDPEKGVERYFLSSFIGRERKGWSPRDQLFRLNNDRDILMMETAAFKERYNGQHTYSSVLRATTFAATPRGDALFSYRFVEVLSAGCIPVVIADGWVLPFRKELVDWKDCAVVIAENEISKLVDVVRGISKEKQCQMQQKCYEIYQNYMVNPEAVMRGVVDSIVARDAAQKRSGR